MRLRTRLTVASGAIVAVAAVSVGFLGIAATEREQTRGLEAVLASGAKQVSEARQSPLTAALLVGEQSQVALTIALHDVEREITTVRFSRAVIDPKTSLATLRQAATKAVAQRYRGHYLLRSVPLPSQEYVLIATTLADVDATRARGLRILGLALALSVAAGVAIIFMLVRRDLKVVEQLIAAAGRMAGGDTRVQIPAGATTSEVDSLARALRLMVESLNSAVDRERELANRMQTFLGDASHELRTPLTVVRGYVELLRSHPGFQEATAQRYLTRIGSETARMEALIRDLLLLTETGNQPLREPADVDLSQMAEQFVDDLRHLNPGRDVSAHIAADLHVQGSPDLLAQMFSNLFRNVDIHTPPAAAVHLTLQPHGPAAVLTLDDAGPGLSEEMYASGIHAFQRFDPSRSRDTGGSGLGMSIIAAVVAHHGGEISLARADLGGLRTTIALPLSSTGVAGSAS